MKSSRLIPLTRLAVAVALSLASGVAQAAPAAVAKEASKGISKTDSKTEPKGAATSNAALKTAPKLTTHTAQHIPLPRPRATRVAMVPANPASPPPTSAAPAPLALTPAPRAYAPVASQAPMTVAPAIKLTPGDLVAVKQAIKLIRRGKTDEATSVEQTIGDPVAAKLVEWLVLRSDSNSGMHADRYMAFVNANPGWSSVGMLRRRAEAALWDDKRDPATVRAFFSNFRPSLAKGRFALAKALLAQGDRDGAQHYVRAAWHEDAFSSDLEAMALNIFGALLTPGDHKARMDARFYAEDVDAALREAHRLNGVELAIAMARAAVIRKAANAGVLLDAVPNEARRDAGYIFSRIQWLRRNDRIAEAGHLVLTVPRDPALIRNADEWWVERRLLARKLLDIGDARTAYLVARDAVPPQKENYRAELEFTAGWIALRFLNDPTTALAHFARVGAGTANPITLARAGYWQGRAAEAAGRPQEARAYYDEATHYPTAYYGQLARARVGFSDIGLHPPPQPNEAQRAAIARLDVVRAVSILYAIDERDLVIPMVADLAERIPDIGALVVLAELAGRHDDARSMLIIGKAALSRGFAFDLYAFPHIGVPNFTKVGPQVDRSVVYAIVRQESAFNPKDVSSANAFGLMQVTPDAGRYVAKKYGVAFDQKRLLHDIVYNCQMGAAELGGVIEDYRSSYILAFAAYNAGKGRVREWLKRYGDPRDPGVDPIDWVERIPFSETRNYVQRVMENVQVYRARFGGGTRLMIEADLRRGAGGN